MFQGILTSRTVSFCSMVTTIVSVDISVNTASSLTIPSQVLFKGLSAPLSQILTLVLAFLTICVGITILQMSKIDPAQLSKLDRRSTMLLQAARATTEGAEEKGITGMEDPGIEALRGSFGTMSSIIRARSTRKMSQSSRLPVSPRSHPDGSPSTQWQQHDINHTYDGLTRHQLYDAPVPRLSDPERSSSVSSGSTTLYSPRRTTIKFGSQDLVHSYRPPGSGNADAIHEHRSAVHTPPIQAGNLPYIYPPTSGSATPSGSSSQLITVPPRANDEPPAPTISTNFEHPITNDPFDTPTTPTMSAFPSSSDSSTRNSPPRRDNIRPPARTHRGASPRYPKGVDDVDESISLWERTSPVYDEETEEIMMQPVQGVRLVKPSSSSTWL